MALIAVRAEIRVAGDGYSLKPGDLTVVDNDDPRVARQIERGALTPVDVAVGPLSGVAPDLGPDPGPVGPPPPPG